MNDSIQDTAERLSEEFDHVGDDALDDEVIDAALRIASAVNNGGLLSQIEFCLEQGLTEQEIREALTD